MYVVRKSFKTSGKDSFPSEMLRADCRSSQSAPTLVNLVGIPGGFSHRNLEEFKEEIPAEIIEKKTLEN